MTTNTIESPARIPWLRAVPTFVWIALVVGFMVRVAALTQTVELGPKIIDEQHYVQLATSLRAGEGFAWAPGEPTSLRPPLYPTFVALIWAAGGDGNLQAVRVVQQGIALLTAYLVFLIGRRVYGPRAGWMAASMVWLYPSLIFFSTTILTETLFTCLLVAFVLVSMTVTTTPRWWLALTCGVVLGFAALTRSVMTPLPVVFCPLMIWLVRGQLRTKVAMSALIFAGFIATVGPWAVRNTRLQGVTTIVDTMGGINLRMGNYEHTPEERMWDAVALTGERNWAFALVQQNPGVHFTEGQKDKWAQREAVRYMVTNPGITLRRSLIRFADFWGLEREFVAGVQKGYYNPPRWFTALAALAIVAGYVLVVAAGGAAMWLTRPATIRDHLLLLLPVALIMGVHVLVFGHSRYHMPLIPLFAVYAAALPASLARVSWSGARSRTFAAAATVVVLQAVWVRQVFIVDASRLRALLEQLG